MGDLIRSVNGHLVTSTTSKKTFTKWIMASQVTRTAYAKRWDSAMFVVDRIILWEDTDADVDGGVGGNVGEEDGDVEDVEAAGMWEGRQHADHDLGADEAPPHEQAAASSEHGHGTIVSPSVPTTAAAAAPHGGYPGGTMEGVREGITDEDMKALGMMSVKELKALIASAGLRHDDCIEKNELRTRATAAMTLLAPQWDKHDPSSTGQSPTMGTNMSRGGVVEGPPIVRGGEFVPCRHVRCNNATPVRREYCDAHTHLEKSAPGGNETLPPSVESKDGLEPPRQEDMMQNIAKYKASLAQGGQQTQPPLPPPPQQQASGGGRAPMMREQVQEGKGQAHERREEGKEDAILKRNIETYKTYLKEGEQQARQVQAAPASPTAQAGNAEGGGQAEAGGTGEGDEDVMMRQMKENIAAYKQGMS